MELNFVWRGPKRASGLPTYSRILDKLWKVVSSVNKPWKAWKLGKKAGVLAWFLKVRETEQRMREFPRYGYLSLGKECKSSCLVFKVQFQLSQD